MPLSLHFQVSIGTSSKGNEGIGLSGIGSDNFRKHLRLFYHPFSIHLTIEGGWRIAFENRIKDIIAISLNTYRNFTASSTSVSILPSAQDCESHFSLIGMIRVEDRSTDFWCSGIIKWRWLLYRWNMRNSGVVSKLLCSTHSFGCASMSLRKKETEERIRIRCSTGILYISLQTLPILWKLSHSEYCQKLAMIKRASFDIGGVTLVGSAGTWAMLETDKMQHSH